MIIPNIIILKMFSSSLQEKINSLQCGFKYISLEHILYLQVTHSTFMVVITWYSCIVHWSLACMRCLISVFPSILKRSCIYTDRLWLYLSISGRDGNYRGMFRLPKSGICVFNCILFGFHLWVHDAKQAQLLCIWWAALTSWRKNSWLWGRWDRAYSF